jgi:Fe2+ transport system protein FeoA
MKKISHLHLKENEKAKIAAIDSSHNLEKRLMHMGLYKGKEIAKLSHIGLRGPVVVKIGRSILALGHNVSSKIIVEK